MKSHVFPKNTTFQLQLPLLPDGSDVRTVTASTDADLNTTIIPRISKREDNVLNALFYEDEHPKWKIVSNESAFIYPYVAKIMSHMIGFMSKDNFAKGKIAHELFLQNTIRGIEAAGNEESLLIEQWRYSSQVAIPALTLLVDFGIIARGERVSGVHYEILQKRIDAITYTILQSKDDKHLRFPVFNQPQRHVISGKTWYVFEYSEQMRSQIYKVDIQNLRTLESSTMVGLRAKPAIKCYGILPPSLYEWHKKNPDQRKFYSFQELAKIIGIGVGKGPNATKRALGISSKGREIKRDFFEILQAVSYRPHTFHVAPAERDDPKTGKKIEGIEAWLTLGKIEKEDFIIEDSVIKTVWKSTVMDTVKNHSQDTIERVMQLAEIAFEDTREEAKARFLSVYEIQLLQDTLKIDYARQTGCGNTLFLCRQIIGDDNFNAALHETKVVSQEGKITTNETAFLIGRLKELTAKAAVRFARNEVGLKTPS